MGSLAPSSHSLTIGNSSTLQWKMERWDIKNVLPKKEIPQCGAGHRHLCLICAGFCLANCLMAVYALEGGFTIVSCVWTVPIMVWPTTYWGVCIEGRIYEYVRRLKNSKSASLLLHDPSCFILHDRNGQQTNKKLRLPYKKNCNRNVVSSPVSLFEMNQHPTFVTQWQSGPATWPQEGFNIHTVPSFMLIHKVHEPLYN
jgi:hypothetical protein